MSYLKSYLNSLSVRGRRLKVLDPFTAFSQIEKSDDEDVKELKEIYLKLAGDSPALDTSKALSKASLLRGIAALPLGETPALPILTEYPETDATKAGQRFWYKGNEWHWMTQAEIDSTGWTGLVEVGFPAPVYKGITEAIIFQEADYILVYPTTGTGTTSMFIVRGYTDNRDDSIIDFVGFGTPPIIPHIKFSRYVSVAEFKNAALLTNLKDSGTTPSLVLGDGGVQSVISAETLNDLFTQLPATNKTATIDVKFTTGAATCDPTIATAKGYTVVTS